MEITKRHAKSLLDLTTDAALARFFGGISRWAVGQWGEDSAIPEGRYYEMRAKRPDLFDADGNPLAAPVCTPTPTTPSQEAA